MRYRKQIALFFAILLSALLLPSCGREPSDDLRVAVIVKAVDSDFWHGVKAGVEAAGIEYNVTVTFEGPENEEDSEAQSRLISQAVENGADVIVLSAIDEEKNAKAVEDAVRRGVPVIAIDSSVNSRLVSQFIGTDNYEAGKAAARAAADFTPRDGAKIRIGLVNYMADTANGRRREEGFRDCIAALGNAEIVASVTADSNEENATACALQLLERHPEVNVLVGFNEWMTLGVGNAILQSGKSGAVRGVGFDSNTASVGMLESGVMDALVVQNPFAIGYLGVRNAALLVLGDDIGADTIATDMTTVTKENLFDADIQKILFRFS